MKKLLASLLFILAVALPLAGLAADITITVTAPQAARLTAAFRALTGNPNAGLAELKEHLIRELRAIVILYEKQEAEKTITVPVFDPS